MLTITIKNTFLQENVMIPNFKIPGERSRSWNFELFVYQKHSGRSKHLKNPSKILANTFSDSLAILNDSPIFLLADRKDWCSCLLRQPVVLLLQASSPPVSVLFGPAFVSFFLRSSLFVLPQYVFLFYTLFHVSCVWAVVMCLILRLFVTVFVVHLLSLWSASLSGSWTCILLQFCSVPWQGPKRFSVIHPSP